MSSGSQSALLEKETSLTPDSGDEGRQDAETGNGRKKIREHNGAAVSVLEFLPRHTSGLKSPSIVQRIRSILLLVLIVVNIIVIVVCLLLLTIKDRKSTAGSEGCGSRNRKLVAPLSVPCSRGDNDDRQESEEGEGGWLRHVDDDEGDELCSPLNYGNVASAVTEIFRTVLKDEIKLFIKNPPHYEFFTTFDDKPSTPTETLLYTNRYKPSGHVTRQGESDKGTTSMRVPGISEDARLLRDWPLRVQYYRSRSNGFVQRMTWGLAVPVSGVYRVHSSVNFFFNYPVQRRTKDVGEKTTDIPIIHQIVRYHAKDGNFSVLAERNQSACTVRTDGLTSFLVALADLDIGDVICTGVSRRSQSVVHKSWHTEGLSLVS